MDDRKKQNLSLLMIILASVFFIAGLLSYVFNITSPFADLTKNIGILFFGLYFLIRKWKFAYIVIGFAIIAIILSIVNIIMK
ncbi:hypothetical protein J3T65_02885 [Staphylococcus simiae]|uniref:hypothetical protein n=1 Tax=Staphylococcus simiae TaxID=308354 RepID=UPI001A963675|nr:hypothetical protein [Staphylococcus simiae]MBO1198411.1 hypothetical protein [Staphylococcus simiae]MBO1200605.1 hypothetical protein [Staphylococcus simiae]MBO1202876.1 hypothetical protein [Staphylococcus simiae]MBO1210402.1 hypothetical protein [Staphylococcus simiae]MBO1228942.1 hypothetical protein [Staphylococcus simiae]